MGYRTLIYEPDEASGKALMRMLSTSDCGFVWCDTSTEAVAMLKGIKVDMAVVSLSPNGSGLDIIDHLCATGSTVPFLILTDANELETRVHGLNRGAVDYLIRPFTADELLTRVFTAMHRREKSNERFVRRGRIELDRESGQLGDGSRWTVLSPTEGKILSLLFGCGDRLLSKQRLKDVLADGGSISDNALEVSIHRLRIKVRSWGLRIRAFRRLGYVLEDIREILPGPAPDRETHGSNHAKLTEPATKPNAREIKISVHAGGMDDCANKLALNER